jgi:hypothetical protein
VSHRDGVSWLVTPCGEPFFSLGVNALNPGPDQRVLAGRVHYSWKAFYPSMETWAEAARGRVARWGFNTAGGWSAPSSLLGLPFAVNLELGRTASFHWVDPFHPDTEARMRETARRLVAPYRGNPRRIGYFTDNEVGWWGGALFVYYLQKPPFNHTKQCLVQLLRDHYEGDWSRFCIDFAVQPGIDSFDDLLRTHGAVARIRPGGQGIRMVRQWTAMVAGRYYRLAAQAIREADPDALILGDRLPIYYDPAAVRAMVPHVDVISTNYNVDSPEGWVAPYFFDGLEQLAGGTPVLISEWFYAARENRTGNRNNGHLMTVDTQAERALGAAAATEQFARRPRIVGVHWFQYFDHPAGGRHDGEDYNFGLVDVDDRPYEALTEALALANGRAPEVHRGARRDRPRAGAPIFVPYARIHAGDGSLADWPKPASLLPPLRAPDGEIPFGEFYMSWSEQGLNLAFIGMDYHDLEILVYDGDFPLEEAVRLDWGVAWGQGERRFRLFVIPPEPTKETKDQYAMRVVLCAGGEGLCEPVPGAWVRYFGSDQPRITLEAAVPWEAVGLGAAPVDGTLRVEVGATAFHRSRWMSLSGVNPGSAMGDASRWPEALLAPRAPQGDARGEKAAWR